MKSDITPENSACPIFLEPIDPEQIKENENKIKERAKATADKAKAKQAVLERLGITADEAALLLG